MTSELLDGRYGKAKLLKLDLAEVKAVSVEPFDHLERLGLRDVEIPMDYYWHIPSEILYDMNSPPQEFTVGHLSDEWISQKMMMDEERPIVYGLVWLASILRALGENVTG